MPRSLALIGTALVLARAAFVGSAIAQDKAAILVS